MDEKEYVNKFLLAVNRLKQSIKDCCGAHLYFRDDDAFLRFVNDIERRLFSAAGQCFSSGEVQVLLAIAKKGICNVCKVDESVD